MKKYPTIAPISAWSKGDTVYDAIKIPAIVAEIHPSVTTTATKSFIFDFVVTCESFEYSQPVSSPTRNKVTETSIIVVVIGVTILVCHFLDMCRC